VAKCAGAAAPYPAQANQGDQPMTRLTAGDKAPEFTLLDDKGEQVSLSDFRGRKVILYAGVRLPRLAGVACERGLHRRRTLSRCARAALRVP